MRNTHQLFILITAVLSLSGILSAFAANVDQELLAGGGGACTSNANGADWDTIAQCVSSAWQRGAYFFGSTTDTCDGSHAGMTQWTGSVLKFCNGTAWKTVQPQNANGYFVLTKGTYDGNLGGRAGADATCLTELTTNTGWKGYAQANATGLLTSTKVHALLCELSSCAHFQPNTTYKFANANDNAQQSGGNSFTTDANGYGPNDNNAWSGAGYFNATVNAWTGFRYTDNGKMFQSVGFTSGNYYCGTTGTGYNSNAAGVTGKVGLTSSSSSARWNSSAVACNLTEYLYCIVDP